jgi:uncharacterized Zn-finger protein
MVEINKYSICNVAFMKKPSLRKHMLIHGKVSSKNTV